MKKILFILAVLIFTACDDKKSVTISIDEYQQLKGQVNSYPKPFDLGGFTDMDGPKQCILLGSDGHDYVAINRAMNTGSVVHSPECPKCKELRHDETLTIINELRKDSIK